MNTLYINSFSSISGQKAKLGHDIVFESTEILADNILKSIYRHLDIKYPKYHKMDLLCKLGFLSSEMLLRNGALHSYQAHEVALIMANSQSTIAIDTEYQKSIQNTDEYFPSPALFVYTLPNIVLGEIAIRHGFKGEIGLLIQEQFNAEQLYQYISLAMLDSELKACVGGWLDIDHQNNYSACLFLIEKQKNSLDSITFDKENIISIFNHI